MYSMPKASCLTRPTNSMIGDCSGNHYGFVMTEEEFRAQLDTKGYHDVAVKEWEPNADGEFHTHDFSAMLLVTRGEFRLVLEDETRSFGPGQWCEVPIGTVHYEQAGVDGASVIAGSK